MEIFDIIGRKIRTLPDEYKAVGVYKIDWAGLNGSGQPAASGVYIYRMQAERLIQSKKMLMVK